MPGTRAERRPPLTAAGRRAGSFGGGGGGGCKKGARKRAGRDEPNTARPADIDLLTIPFARSEFLLAAGYGRQASANAVVSTIAGAGRPGSLPYSFTAPVTVSVTLIV